MLVKRSTTTPELYTSKKAIKSLFMSRGVGFKRTSTLGQASLVETPGAISGPLHGAVDKRVKNSIATQQEAPQARRYAVERPWGQRIPRPHTVPLTEARCEVRASRLRAKHDS